MPEHPVDIEAIVHNALAEHYDEPLVLPAGPGDGVSGGAVAVLAGRALNIARTAAVEAGLRDVEGLVRAIELADCPWAHVPPRGLRLWRQHGRAGDQGELVTEVVEGDPPLQLLAERATWRLVRLADGATGWLEPDAAASLDAVGACDPQLGDSASIDRGAFIAAAIELEGAPYVWGGTTISGVDCSGLVQRAAWQSSRCWLPRHSRALLQVGARVSPSAAAPGDVLVLKRGRRAGSSVNVNPSEGVPDVAGSRRAVPATGPAVHPMHVAVVIDDDMALHASRDRLQVVREPLATLRERYRVLGVRRLGSVDLTAEAGA